MGQMNSITGYITQLLTQHVGQFAFLGQAMFLSLATIMIVWFGLKSALAASEHGSGFHFGNFAGLVMMIAFGYAMTQYYDIPIPGIGRSFYHLIIDETEYLSSIISGSQLQNASDAISQYQSQICMLDHSLCCWQHIKQLMCNPKHSKSFQKYLQLSQSYSFK